MDSDGESLTVYGSANAVATQQFWLVDVGQDGTLAWRMLGRVISPKGALAVGETRFDARDYRDGVELEQSLHEALVGQGLLADEAEALLNTWRQSYFRNPGLRLFFMVNPAWTNRVLPLNVSGNVSITRVMMGRIELVTPWQRELIGQITSGGIDPGAPPNQCPAYEQLGRFRNALLLDEILRHPNARVENWLFAWGVRAFAPR